MSDCVFKAPSRVFYSFHRIDRKDPSCPPPEFFQLHREAHEQTDAQGNIALP